ncbi:MAG: hypothetical protein HC892_10805 [Saprospiraceae bacterium]|nr:hypothetical protein [Saprospiraceae bacterium]
MKGILLLFSTILLWLPSKMIAQNEKLESIARQYVATQAPQWNLTAEDVRNMTVSDLYRTAHNGVTHVYFIQTHQGIALHNAIMNVSILPNQRVLFANSRFLPDLAAAVNTTLPILNPEAAIEKAAVHLKLQPDKTIEMLERVGNTEFYFSRSWAG